VFLVGGPAFSGTTLLALLLNQRWLLCLDEPDFHDPEQSHRNIPFLRELFPGVPFPATPDRRLTFDQATDLMEQCEAAISPWELGMKTCDSYFLGYADSYQRRGYPIICIVRDIRDALVRPLPPWLNEEKLNERYRQIWERAQTLDVWIRYEDLVADPGPVIARLSDVLGRRLSLREAWEPDQVHPHMVKAERHELLRLGHISSSRVGVWRRCGRRLDPATHETARLMGY
jgi:hypothetical protein